MFTNNKIKLSDLPSELNLEILRDASFSFCGKIDSVLPDRIVYVEREDFVMKLKEKLGIAAVVCPHELSHLVPQNFGLIIHKAPRFTLNRIQSLISRMPDFQWTSFKTEIPTCCTIHPRSVVFEHDVLIGKNVQIGPNAVIHPRTILHDNCRVGANSTVGCDAFEINEQSGIPMRFEQSGGVIVGKNANILSNTCITRATYGGFTKVGANVMIDNLVHVAHDVIIEDNVKIMACAEISGRVHIEANSTIGMNVTILNGLTIGANSHVSLGSVVTKNVMKGSRVTGNFAIAHSEFLKKLKSK